MNDEWRRDSRPAEFVRIIQAIKPDVICLQEVNPARDPQQVGDILDSALPLLPVVVDVVIRAGQK